MERLDRVVLLDQLVHQDLLDNPDLVVDLERLNSKLFSNPDPRVRTSLN